MNNNPNLPSAKPPKSLALILISLSGLMLLTGTGLGASAVAVYRERANNRLDQNNALAALEQNAAVSQRSAQLKRGYSAPVWDASQVYDPSRTYFVPGTRRTPVPVLIGPELDTAVCIGVMGPAGFTQDINAPLCLGY